MCKLVESKMSFILFRPGGGGGGGRILPAATLHVINFLNVKANATKLGDFFQNLFGDKKNMTCQCPRDLTFPWQPYFGRHFNFSD